MKEYILASRPKTLIAAIMPLCISFSFFYTDHLIDSGSIILLLLMFLSSLGIQIATNYYNDAYDDLNGFDEKRVGPARMSATKQLSGKNLIKAANIILIFSFLLALPLAYTGGFYFSLLGILSLYLAYGYSAGFLPLAQNGLGEIFTFLFFGLFAVNGSFYILSSKIDPSLFLISIQYSFFITLIITMNNLRDINTDRESGKKTLATKIGYQRYTQLIYLMTALPFIMIIKIQNLTLLIDLPLYLFFCYLIHAKKVKKAFTVSCIGLVVISISMILDFVCLPKELSFQCHQLVKDIKKADLPIYKIKLHSNDPKESALFLIKLFNQFEFQARLDFNSKWKLEEVLQLFKRLNGHHKRIEYIEDPIPFNIAKWEKLKQEQVPLAIDHHFNQTGEVPSFVENVIYRPYFSSHWEEELQNKKIIVTQNFSHAWNYYSSLIYAQDYPNQTHGLYPSSEIQYNKKGNLFNIDMSLFEQLNNKMNELQWQIF